MPINLRLTAVVYLRQNTVPWYRFFKKVRSRDARFLEPEAGATIMVANSAGIPCHIIQYLTQPNQPLA
jgi:hypothetical protein